MSSSSRHPIFFLRMSAASCLAERKGRSSMGDSPGVKGSGGARRALAVAACTSLTAYLLAGNKVIPADATLDARGDITVRARALIALALAVPGVAYLIDPQSPLNTK